MAYPAGGECPVVYPAGGEGLVARPVADGGEGLELDLDISEEEGPEYPPTTST